MSPCPGIKKRLPQNLLHKGDTMLIITKQRFL